MSEGNEDLEDGEIFDDDDEPSAPAAEEAPVKCEVAPPPIVTAVTAKRPRSPSPSDRNKALLKARRRKRRLDERPFPQRKKRRNEDKLKDKDSMDEEDESPIRDDSPVWENRFERDEKEEDFAQRRGRAREFPKRNNNRMRNNRGGRRMIGNQGPNRRENNNRNQGNGTEMCKFFAQGNCHRNLPNRRYEVCKFYMADTCTKREKCTYMHEDYPCKYHLLKLKCYAGKRCKFSHHPITAYVKQMMIKHNNLDGDKKFIVQLPTTRSPDRDSAEFSDFPNENENFDQEFNNEQFFDGPPMNNFNRNGNNRNQNFNQNRFEERPQFEENRFDERPRNRFEQNQNRFEDRGPPNRFEGANRFDGPQNRFDGPPNRFDGPQNRFDGPQNRFDGPQNRFEGPQNRFDGPQNRFDGPQNRFEGPPNHKEGPSNRFEGQNRFDGPPNRFDGPPNRFDNPQNFDGPPRFDGPQNFEQQNRFDERPNRFEERQNRFEESNRFSERPSRFEDRPQNRFEDRENHSQERTHTRFDDNKKSRKRDRFSKDKPKKKHDEKPIEDDDEGSRTPMPSPSQENSCDRDNFSPEKENRANPPENDTKSSLTENKPEDTIEEPKSEILSTLPPIQRDLFMRIQQQQKSEVKEEKDAANDEEFKEDGWYSSDDEGNPLATILKTIKPKPPPQSIPTIPKNLLDIDINEVSKLLETIKQKGVEKEKKEEAQEEKTETKRRVRDPRLLRTSNNQEEKPKSDVDLRLGLSMGLMTSNDIDLRQLPFKPAPVHQAANEIDASINSHAIIPWFFKPFPVQPKPDYTGIQSKCIGDPRLKRFSGMSQTIVKTVAPGAIVSPFIKMGQPEEPPPPMPLIRDPRQRALANDPRRKNQPLLPTPPPSMRFAVDPAQPFHREDSDLRNPAMFMGDVDLRLHQPHPHFAFK